MAGMATAGELLRIYEIRMAMQEDGTTKPSEAGRQLTKLLVEKLSQIDSTEQIEINNNDENLAKFIRVATGETIAILEMPNV
jgi:hypothetical protein